MTRTKWIMAFILIGILFSMSAVSIYMPKMIEWYFEPPSNIGISCAPAITWAFDKFQVAQLVSAGVGAVIGLLIGVRMTRKKNPSVTVQN